MSNNDAHSSEALARIRELACNYLGSNAEDSFSCSISESDQRLLEDFTHDGVGINGDKIIFDSIEIVTQLSAEHYFFSKQVGDKAEHISLALELAEKEGRGDGRAAGRYLALVNGDEDIFLCAASAISDKKRGTFEILDVIQAAMPLIDEISIPGLIAMCDAQYQHTKNDLAGGYFFGKLAEAKKGDHAFFRALLTGVHVDLRESTSSLYTKSLFDLSDAGGDEAYFQAYNDTDSSNPILTSNALWFLGRLAFQKQLSATQLKQVVSVLRAKAFDLDDEVRRAAICAVIDGALSHSQLSDFLDELLQTEDQNVLGRLAVAMMQNSDDAKKHPNHDRWIDALSNLSPEFKGAISSLDSILSSLLKEGQHDQVIACLEKWFIAHGDEFSGRKEIIDPFKTTIIKIIENEPIRSRLLTEWIVSDERQLVRAADALLGELHLHKVSDIQFGANVIDHLNTPGIILLIRRTLGIVLHDDQTVSLIFSLLNAKNAPKATLDLVEEALTHDVGIDFPNATKTQLKALKKSTKSNKLKAMCDRVTVSIEAYFGALKALPRIKELMPDKELAHRISKQQAKIIHKYKKEADKDSVFANLFSVVHLKSGRASFSFHDGQYMPPTHMHSFEHSFSLPRRHNLDTVGYEMQRFTYRYAPKGKT